MKTMPRGLRTRILLRSLAIQGSWNYETLIGSGFAFALLPALQRLHGEDGPELRSALSRHLELFNSHPYFATVAIGAVSRLEADQVDPLVIQRFKSALRGSLGSMGDRLIWSAWRPMSLLVGLCLLLLGAAWWVAIAAFLIVYNWMHAFVRIAGLRAGAAAGLEVGKVLREAPLQGAMAFASSTASFLIALAVVLVAGRTYTGSIAGVVIALACVLGISLGLRTRRVMIAILVGVAVLALASGWIGYGA